MKPSKSLRIFFNEVSKQTPMSKSEEIAVITQAKAGSEKARQEVVERNLKFVISVAKTLRYDKTMELTDLISEGISGLYVALDKFDTTRKIKFMSYAVWWVRQAMLSYIKKEQKHNGVNIDDVPLEDVSYIKNDNLERSKAAILKALDQLEPREANVIKMYYGIDRKSTGLKETGRMIGFSGEWTRIIKDKALRKLKRPYVVGGLESALEYFF